MNKFLGILTLVLLLTNLASCTADTAEETAAYDIQATEGDHGSDKDKPED